MAWASLSINVPASLQTVMGGLQECRASVPGELDKSLARLDALDAATTVDEVEAISVNYSVYGWLHINEN